MSKSNMGEIKNLINGMMAEFEKDDQITDYVTKRRTLNLLIIQEVIGCDITTTKKGKIKGRLRWKKPDNSTLCEIQQLLILFKKNVENYLVEEAEDDMDIPDVDPVALAKKDKLGKMFGHLCGQEYGIVNRNIGPGDVIVLASIGDIIRKKNAWRMTFIIGGIILGTAAVGTTAAILIHNKNKKKAELICSDDTLIETDDNLDVDDVVDLGDEYVELDTESIDLI